MKNPVERLLYITLVLMFLGLGLALYIVALVIHGQSEQLKKIEAINQTQTRTIAEIRATQANIELSDQRNAKIIICMLQVPVAQRTTDLEQHCRSQVATQIIQSSQATSNPTKPTATPSPTSLASPAPSPAPSPQPTPTEQILNFIKGLL